MSCSGCTYSYWYDVSNDTVQELRPIVWAHSSNPWGPDWEAVHRARWTTKINECSCRKEWGHVLCAIARHQRPIAYALAYIHAVLTTKKKEKYNTICSSGSHDLK